jgi:hypothetical protein
LFLAGIEIASPPFLPKHLLNPAQVVNLKFRMTEIIRTPLPPAECFNSLSFQLSIISSNRQKVSDIEQIVGVGRISWRQYEPPEYQASKEFDRLRLSGAEHYPYIARESALQKFELIRKDLGDVEPGATIVDSSLWQVAFHGLPGLNAAQMYASLELADGVVRRSEEVLEVTCSLARTKCDRRVYWIETAVTAEVGDDGNIQPKVRQQVGLCFIPDQPWPTGCGMWPITCPNPVRLAAVRGDIEAVSELSAISDTKYEMPRRAAEMGLLVPFAALGDDERVSSSPRGELFTRWSDL